MGNSQAAEPRFALCIQNDGYAASLEPRKLYEVLPDAEAAGLNQLRVVDESGEDYLYPAGYFAQLQLPVAIEQALRRAS